MQTEIQLTFYNQSNDQNNSEVVIFQRNEATTFDEIAVAWKVIKNCGTNWHHKFGFPMEMAVSASDAFGNSVDSPMAAYNGQKFHVYRSPSGDALSYKEEGEGINEVQLKNDLHRGSINAEIYKGGKLLALKTGVSPGQKAVFQFKPVIYIGVVSQVKEGQVMNSAIISEINSKLDLLGVLSADIIMSGGGTGPDARPFEFKLANVVKNA